MLDPEAILADVNETTRSHVKSLKVFNEIASTNSYLMDRPGPPPGDLHIAATTNQTAGRGRQGRRWLSPPGSGLCLSIAYTVASRTDNLSALTLAMGIGAITSLQDVNAHGIRIKWPNDLVVEGRKLGGILTEAKTHGDGCITVVIGVGLNLDLGEGLDLGSEAKRAMPVADLKRIVATMPAPDILAARLINRLHAAIMNFEAAGFAYFVENWAKHDWLLGRELTVDTSSEQLRGTGAGVARDGALLVDVGSGDPRRITAGTIVTAPGSSGGSFG